MTEVGAILAAMLARHALGPGVFLTEFPPAPDRTCNPAAHPGHSAARVLSPIP
jgi:hypothetical protein